MAKQLILAARGFKLGDIEIKHAAVAYDPGAKCERGYRIDHRARIIAAIEKQIRAPIMIFFVPMSVVGGTVVSAQSEQVVIEPRFN